MAQGLAQVYVQAAIGHTLASLFPIQLEHKVGCDFIEILFQSQNQVFKVRGRSHVKGEWPKAWPKSMFKLQ